MTGWLADSHELRASSKQQSSKQCAPSPAFAAGMLTLVLPASYTSLLLLVSDLNIPMFLLSVIVTTEHAPSAFFLLL